jgi:hypothetical protein
VALDIPAEARKAAGLDAFPQAVIVSRCNRAEWPDLVRTIPGRTTPVYGRLPPDFVARFRSAVAEAARRHLLRGRAHSARAPDPVKPGPQR